MPKGKKTRKTIMKEAARELAREVITRCFSFAFCSSKSNARPRAVTSMVQLAYDVLWGSLGLIQVIVFFVTALTVFFGVCNFLTYCGDKIQGLWITRPLRALFK